MLAAVEELLLQPAEDSGRLYVNSTILVGDLKTTFSTESPKLFTRHRSIPAELAGAMLLLWEISDQFQREGKKASLLYYHGVYFDKPKSIRVDIGPTVCHNGQHDFSTWYG